MKIIELTISDFEKFVDNHPLRNYAQTSKYAKVMGEKGYLYDYIGYTDDSNNLVAASLILTKKIGAFEKFAYAPKGFLINYYDENLLKMFILDISKYYKDKGFAFIKINPEIIIGELDINKLTTNYNRNVSIIDTLKDLGFKRRKEIRPLDFIFPRLNPYINLKTFNSKDINDSFKDIINNKNSALSIEVSSSREVSILYDFIKNNTYESVNYYRNILNTFKDESDLLLIKIDNEDALIKAQNRYEKEQEENNYWNQMIQNDNNEKNINEKMASDKRLIKYKDEMVYATEKLRKNKYEYIGGALIIKYKNRISIVVSGFNNIDAGYYLINYLIDNYKNDYDFLDLNGIASDFDSQSKYYEYNEFKLAFNPTIYEYIGEFDLVLNDMMFKRVQSKGLLSKEFYPSYKI